MKKISFEESERRIGKKHKEHQFKRELAYACDLKLFTVKEIFGLCELPYCTSKNELLDLDIWEAMTTYETVIENRLPGFSQMSDVERFTALFAANKCLLFKLSVIAKELSA